MKLTLLNSVSISILIFLASACSPIQTTTPIPPATLQPLSGATTNSGSVPVSTNQPSKTNPPSVAPTKPAPAASSQPVPPVSGPLSLRVVSPQDGATVSTAQIQVSGLASPGEVVTVNDSIIVVGADGQFQTTVSLDQGPNLIEVIASNNSGNETNVELTVTYLP